MAITFLRNQAINFPTGLECGPDYCQPLNWGDELMAQGTISPIDSNSICPDSSFDDDSQWTNGTSWTFGSSKATYAYTSGSSLLASNTMGLVAGRMYKFKGKAVVTSAVGVAAGAGYIITINGQEVPLQDVDPGDGCKTSLEIEWYFIAGAITTDDVRVNIVGATGTSLQFYMDYTHVYRVSEVVAELFTQAGVSEGAAGTISYIEEVAYNEALASARFNFTFTLSDEVGEVVGCYYLCFYDAYGTTTNLILNGTFTSSLVYWTVVGSEWTQNSGHALFTYVDGSSRLLQTHDLAGGENYNLTFDYDVTSGADQFSVVVRVSGVVISTTVVTGTDTGYVVPIDLTSYTGVQSVEIRFICIDPGAVFWIDNVILLSDETIQDCTGCFTLKESHTNTLLFLGSNSDNAFDFDYTSEAFRHKIRLEAKVDFTNYPSEIEEYRFSDGSRSQIYARREELWTVKVGDAPKRMHDCLSLVALHDNFTITNSIDTTQYVAKSEYRPAKRKHTDSFTATFDVMEEQQIGDNRSCG